MDSIKIGVVGYSATDFSEEKARSLIKEGIQKIRSQHSGEPVIVSGLTYLGIPKLAYDFAENNHYSTWGIACEKAEDFDQYDVDTKIITGTGWGDESEQFLNEIDILLRIGGGDQVYQETKQAKNKSVPVYEYELESLD